jgi:hypothetical protein
VDYALNLLRKQTKIHVMRNSLDFSSTERCGRIFEIASGYGLDERGIGVEVPVKVKNFISPYSLDLLWGTYSLLPNGYRGSSSRGGGEVTRQGREDDQ